MRLAILLLLQLFPLPSWCFFYQDLTTPNVQLQNVRWNTTSPATLRVCSQASKWPFNTWLGWPLSLDYTIFATSGTREVQVHRFPTVTRSDSQAEHCAVLNACLLSNVMNEKGWTVADTSLKGRGSVTTPREEFQHQIRVYHSIARPSAPCSESKFWMNDRPFVDVQCWGLNCTASANIKQYFKVTTTKYTTRDNQPPLCQKDNVPWTEKTLTVVTFERRESARTQVLFKLDSPECNEAPQLRVDPISGAGIVSIVYKELS